MEGPIICTDCGNDIFRRSIRRSPLGVYAETTENSVTPTNAATNGISVDDLLADEHVRKLPTCDFHGDTVFPIL